MESLFAPGDWGLPNIVWMLIRILNIAFLIHALMRRDWLWAAFLAFGVFTGGGIFVTLFYAFTVFGPAMQGSGTRTRQAVRQTVKTTAEAVKTLDTRIQEAQQVLGRSDTLANRTQLANLYTRAKRLDDAQATLQPLLSGIYQDDPVVLLTSAELDLAQGHPAQAEAKLTQVELQTSASTKTRALTLLAAAQTQQGNATGAEATYQEAMQTATTEEPRVRYAEFLMDQGRTEDAQRVLERLLQVENEATPLYRRQEREWFELAGRLRRQLRR
ncbi:tetratricopeptide repeat protein [Deinococcus radiophilus]|uniref:Tetratricopeptide repeat protein n=1 Tax=Deinococcus radiophilus TaxID=32062 RepID=A0A3S0L7B5_9DEIO|nr:tetratricopeptide repeat protein [Deinococcus radiophilus]RTR28643.1 tetratricopeptide repeat protein [Deinococcus radiophilus]UFA51065.1 tetratricopeptide repeat protein [Deinococcus radiophilus]